MPSLGQRIRRFRAIKDLTQEEFARRLGVNRSTLANWEVDRAMPDAEMLGRIAEALGASTDDLLGRTSDSKQGEPYSPKTKRLYDIVARADELPDDDLDDMADTLETLVEGYRAKLEKLKRKQQDAKAKGDPGQGEA